MTSASILPSVGPPPPNIRRPNVPEELKPKIANPADDLAAGKQRPSRSRQEVPVKDGEKPPEFGERRPGSGSNSAVAVQVIEGRSQQGAQQAAVDGPSAPEPIVPKSVEDLPPPEDDLKRAGELSPEDQTYVRELQARDREVRAHEAAHATAGSGYTSSPNFEYVTGPDGVQYAVGGHVDIDTGEVPDDPAATIQKMEVVRRAALAPARPSGQDRAVAAAAEQSIREAQAELNEQRAAEAEAATGGGTEDGISPAVAGASDADSAGSIPGSGVEPSAFRPQLISIDLIA